MLGFILAASLTDDNYQSDNERARIYSTQVIGWLRTYRHEIPGLLSNMTQVCAHAAQSEFHDWQRRINTMPDNFVINNFTCLYREIHGHEIIMVAECYMAEPVANYGGKITYANRVYTRIFYVTLHTETACYEMRVLPQHTPTEISAVTSFGQQFFDLMRRV